MKKLTNKSILLCIYFASLATTSCTPVTGCTDPLAHNYNPYAEVYDGNCVYSGCTDPDSKNYDPRADINDGSCTYEGSVVFWYGEAVAYELGYYGIASLTYYVGGQIVGSSASNIYWTGAPDCGHNGSVTVNKDLGKAKSRQYSFSVRDQYNNAVWEGTIDFEANTCIQFELRSSDRKKK